MSGGRGGRRGLFVRLSARGSTLVCGNGDCKNVLSASVRVLRWKRRMSCHSRGNARYRVLINVLIVSVPKTSTQRKKNARYNSRSERSCECAKCTVANCWIHARATRGIQRRGRKALQNRCATTPLQRFIDGAPYSRDTTHRRIVVSN